MKVQPVTGVIMISLSLLFSYSCSMFRELRCAGCNKSDAYSDELAQKLLDAALSGNSDKVEQLVKMGANPNYLEANKVPMLLWALCANNIKGYEALLKAGADPNLGGSGHGWSDTDGYGDPDFTDFRWVKLKRVAVGTVPYKGWSALVMAAGMRDPQYLRLAIKYGGDVNAENGERRNRPLFVAAYEGMFENVKILVEAGADINAQYRNFTNAPYEAFAGGRPDIALWLVEHGYNTDMEKFTWVAEKNSVRPDMQVYKEKLLDLLKAKGYKLSDSNPNSQVNRSRKIREIDEAGVQDIVYGRKTKFDFPKRKGMENQED